MNPLPTKMFPLLALFTLGQLTLPGLDACNPCPSDADGDGVCDTADVCSGFDDEQDVDGDGRPDGCDVCPDSGQDDANGDGVCDGISVTLETLPRSSAIVQRDTPDLKVLHVSGQVIQPGYDRVRLEVDQDDRLFQELIAPLEGDGGGSFAFDVTLPAGQFDYTLRLDLLMGDDATRITTRFDVAVGDLILIQGQSNAVAADYFSEGLANQSQSHWIRSFGSASTDPAAAQADLEWGMADALGYYGHASVGAWGLRLGERLLLATGMPIGLINGAVGGTYIAQHQRNDANPEDLNTIYGRFLYRSRRSEIASSARMMVWYQGESDGFGWGDTSTAAQYQGQFAALRQDWKSDFPALEQIYVFQVRNGCGLDHPGDSSLYLDFRNAAGTTLALYGRDFWASPAWTRYGVTGTAPEGTAWLLYWFVPWAYGPVDFDDASAVRSDGTSLLTNTSFETGSTFPDGWYWGGEGDVTWLQGTAHTGSRSIGLQSNDTYALTYQQVPATPGATYSGDIHARREYTGAWVDIREELRSLPDVFDDVSVMATNGAPGHDGCHFYYEGYRELGDRISRLILHDFYDQEDGINSGAPEVLEAVEYGDREIRLTVRNAEGGLSLDPGIEQNFRIEGAYVTSVQLEGTDTLLLSLSGPTSATTLSYSDRAGESADIFNLEGVGLLSFVDLPLTSISSGITR